MSELAFESLYVFTTVIMDDQNTTSVVADVTKELIEREQDIALQLIEIEKAIKTYVAGIQAKQDEAREHAAAIRDAIENDATYQEIQKRVKEVQKEMNKVKEQIEAMPSVRNAKEQVKAIKMDLKEMQDHLSKRLLEYKKTSGLSEIEIQDGLVQSILEFAKLAKKR